MVGDGAVMVMVMVMVDGERFGAVYLRCVGYLRTSVSKYSYVHLL